MLARSGGDARGVRTSTRHDGPASCHVVMATSRMEADANPSIEATCRRTTTRAPSFRLALHRHRGLPGRRDPPPLLDRARLRPTASVPVEARSLPRPDHAAGSSTPRCCDPALAPVGPAWHPSAMTTPEQDTCEVRIDGAWTPMPVAEASVLHRSADKRCPDCHGRVRAHGTYGPRTRITMMHHRAHDGCPRMPRQYTGTPTPHPEALT